VWNISSGWVFIVETVMKEEIEAEEIGKEAIEGHDFQYILTLIHKS
jgi:hypothetical protein